MKNVYAIVVLTWLSIGPVLAQSLVKQADRQFNEFAYTRAIELYEKALTNPAPISEAEKRDARAKLGYSYQQIRDMPNAERIYRDLITSGNLPTDYARYYLLYAQALASNGKYQEAQAAYEKYDAMPSGTKQTPSLAKIYSDVSNLTSNASSYKVDYLSMNTRRAEFSPMLYKDGLVFVAEGHSKGGLKGLFAGNNSHYLDLYYLPDLKTVASSRSARRDRTQLFQVLGRDEYTAPTPNDNKTIGYYGGPNLNAGYDDHPVSESDRFGRTLNTKYHEGPATFTKDGLKVIFTRNNYNNGQFRESADGVNKLKLYTAVQTDGIWSKAEELPFNSDEYSTGHPTLSKDDQRLYFSSDRPGGFGGTDIYVSTWENGKWGAPANLGPEVNTKGNELFPFLDERGNIYFSSDGRPGLGDLDIYYTTLTPDGKLGQVTRNLGEPLNSAKDDFGIVTDADRTSGYFSSNRKRGGADDDVYHFTRQESLYPCRELMVRIIDAESKMPLANTSLALDNTINDQQKKITTDTAGIAKICLDIESDFKFLVSRDGYDDSKVGFSTRDLLDDKPSQLEIILSKPKPSVISTLRGRVTTQTGKEPIEGVKVLLVSECDGTSEEATTNADGYYEFVIKPGCDYSIEALKDKMGTTGGRIAKDGSGTGDITMFKKGDIVKIENIYYDVNKAAIRPDAAAELDKVAELMKKYPTMIIEMRSHTDSRATASYNSMLSGKRAKSAVAYLKSNGIASNRMIAKGYGESNLLNKCKDGVDCPEEDHQQNRRTEIKIIKLN
jgi:outer membrane protein OmpA-like peptidoglycan-associated protein